jgi:hypothetical protein
MFGNKREVDGRRRGGIERGVGHLGYLLRPEGKVYIAEALDLIVKRYGMDEHAAIREFYSLLRYVVHVV